MVDVVLEHDLFFGHGGWHLCQPLRVKVNVILRVGRALSKHVFGPGVRALEGIVVVCCVVAIHVNFVHLSHLMKGLTNPAGHARTIAVGVDEVDVHSAHTAAITKR